jgi:hypothetical protein
MFFRTQAQDTAIMAALESTPPDVRIAEALAEAGLSELDLEPSATEGEGRS